MVVDADVDRRAVPTEEAARAKPDEVASAVHRDAGFEAAGHALPEASPGEAAILARLESLGGNKRQTAESLGIAQARLEDGRVVSVQDPMYAATNIHNLYARRKEAR